MMFGHAPVFHAEAINLSAPCTEDVWAAGSPIEWHRALERLPIEQPTRSFLDIVKLFVSNPGLANDEITPDRFGSFVVLHGLINVGLQKQRSSQALLGICISMGLTNLSEVSTSWNSWSTTSLNHEPENWKLKFEDSLNAWRKTTVGSLANPSALKFHRSSMSLYRIAQISLYTNFLDLHILAGLDRIMGKPINEEARINMLLQLSADWAPSKGADRAVQHALSLFNETIFSYPYLDNLVAGQQPLVNQDGKYYTFQE